MPKSAIANKDLTKGHILLESDIYYQSPGKGIFEHEISEYIGKELKQNIPQDNFISKKTLIIQF